MARKSRTANADSPGVFARKEARRFVEDATAYRADWKGLAEEVDRIHRNRTVFAMKSKSKSPESLRKAVAAETAARSRVLGIFMDAENAYSDLSSMRDAAMQILLIEGGDADFPKGMTTKTDRKEYMKRELEERTNLRELRKLRDKARYVLEDIDKADWKIDKIIRTFELATRPETHR